MIARPGRRCSLGGGEEEIGSVGAVAIYHQDLEGRLVKT